MAPAQIGLVGLGVMGTSLAQNLISHGIETAGWNREDALADAARASTGGRLRVHRTLEGLVDDLRTPRTILIMIKAGAPVDEMADRLLPLLERGDVVIDGGNSAYRDTMRRETAWAAHGVHWMGMGVSGGEEGARLGPSLMPGGAPEAYQRVRPLLEAIAAKSDAGPCVTHVGPNGAGHFVKTVHNGIEYGDMQIIAEGYDLLRRGAGLSIPAVQGLFAHWAEGPLQSFLIEITADILLVRDEDGSFLLEHVLDAAGQHGTGRWTIQEALALGVAVPTLTAGVDARILSSYKAQRVRAAQIFAPPTPASIDVSPQDVHDALLCARITAYAQGMALIAAASEAHQWNIDLAEVARIWRAGCIIRARLLDPVREAFQHDPHLANLITGGAFPDLLREHQGALRRVVAAAAALGVPAPALAASLAYFDSYRSATLPQNLTQAQRDAFGAHTYQRTDDPTGAAHHSAWRRPLS